MKQDQSLHEEWARIEKEHAHLFTLFERLERATERSEALSALDELQTWLLHHFQREERPEGLLRSLPGDPETVQALVVEHAAILDGIEETRRLLEAAPEATAGEALLRQVTHDLGANLRSHEQHERRTVVQHLAGPGGGP